MRSLILAMSSGRLRISRKGGKGRAYKVVRRQANRGEVSTHSERSRPYYVSSDPFPYQRPRDSRISGGDGEVVLPRVLSQVPFQHRHLANTPNYTQPSIHSKPANSSPWPSTFSSVPAHQIHVCPKTPGPPPVQSPSQTPWPDETSGDCPAIQSNAQTMYSWSNPCNPTPETPNPIDDADRLNSAYAKRTMGEWARRRGGGRK